MHIEVLEKNQNILSVYLAYFLIKKTNRLFISCKENVQVLKQKFQPNAFNGLLNYQKLIQYQNEELIGLFHYVSEFNKEFQSFINSEDSPEASRMQTEIG